MNYQNKNIYEIMEETTALVEKTAQEMGITGDEQEGGSEADGTASETGAAQDQAGGEPFRPTAAMRIVNKSIPILLAAFSLMAAGIIIVKSGNNTGFIFIILGLIPFLILIGAIYALYKQQKAQQK